MIEPCKDVWKVGQFEVHRYYLFVDGKPVCSFPNVVNLPAGKYWIQYKISSNGVYLINRVVFIEPLEEILDTVVPIEEAIAKGAGCTYSGCIYPLKWLINLKEEESEREDFFTFTFLFFPLFCKIFISNYDMTSSWKTLKRFADEARTKHVLCTNIKNSRWWLIAQTTWKRFLITQRTEPQL